MTHPGSQQPGSEDPNGQAGGGAWGQDQPAAGAWGQQPTSPGGWGETQPGWGQQQAPDGGLQGTPVPPYGQQPYGQQPYGQQPYGQPYGGYPYPYFAPRSTNGLAVASLVLGIFWIYWIGSILALVFGYMAKKQIRERGEAGAGMATAGIVLGWIGIGFLVLFIIVGIAASSSSDF